jgi:hypothetical protein
MVVRLMRCGGLLAVMRRMHVGDSARHHDTVEMVEKYVEFQRIHHGRDHHGRAQRHLRHGPHIFVADRVVEETVGFIGVRRKADEGQIGHFRTLWIR